MNGQPSKWVRTAPGVAVIRNVDRGGPGTLYVKEARRFFKGRLRVDPAGTERRGGIALRTRSGYQIEDRRGESSILWTLAVAQAALAALNPAAPAPIADERGQDIVVTGNRPAAAEAGDFVDAIASETGNDRVARWADRICLNVAGVSAAQRDYFVDSIAAVASALNLETVSGRRCAPSATVIFTADPAALLARLEEDRPAFFGSIAGAEKEGFIASTAPVRWLSSAQLRGADGETPFSFYVDPKTGGVERPVPGTRATPSRLLTGSRMDLQAMVVIVDASRLSGISNRSLAAYLAMVVLGNIRQRHEDIRQPSILRLFDERGRYGGAAATGLTRWDLSYLRSLHAGHWNMPAGRRRSLIRGAMARDLDAAR